MCNQILQPVKFSTYTLSCFLLDSIIQGSHSELFTLFVYFAPVHFILHSPLFEEPKIKLYPSNVSQPIVYLKYTQLLKTMTPGRNKYNNALHDERNFRI